MPTFTIETPDGRKLDIEADDEGGAVAGAQDWVAKNPAKGVIRDVVTQFPEGINRGIDATLNLPGTVANLGVRAVNYGAEKLGYEPPLPSDMFVKTPLRAATLFNSDEPAEGMAGRIAGTVGEAVGGAVAPEAGILGAGMRMAPQAVAAAPGVIGAIKATGRGLAERAAAAPASTLYNDAVSTLGAGLAVGGAREADVGPLGEFAAGLAGGLALPSAINTTARVGGGLNEARRFVGKQVQRATDPVQASIDDVADAMIASKTSPEQVRIELVPQPSPNFVARGILEPEIADMISRSYAGESNRSIANTYGIAEGTVGRYVQQYRTDQPLQRNLIDVAKGLRGEGGATPLSNQGRTAMALGGDAESAKRLTDRQEAQPGRVADTVQQTGIQGRNYDDEVTRLATTARADEDRAYAAVRQNAQPVDLRPVIGTMRRRSIARGGEIAEQMNKAADLFFEPEIAVPQQSPATALRLTEMQERVADATASGASPETIARLQRRLDVARRQDDFTRAGRQRKVGQPITDINQFLDQRRELDQMIAGSMNNLGQPTPLTAELTAFRTRINNAARANNRDLTQADLTFSENRTSERLLSDGASLGKTLNQRSRAAIRDFRRMTPTQQEIFRVGFERQMADDALRTPRGNAAARQFNNEGFDAIVEELYPQTAGRPVYQRGQRLLSRLRDEANSTSTITDVMRGSRTGPVQNAIAGQQELTKAAANGLMGRFWKMGDDMANYLARQIGEKAAAERLKLLTTTEPDQMFPMLVRLERSAQTAAERQRWVQMIREFRRVRLSAPEIASTALMAGQGRQEPAAQGAGQ